VFGSMYDSFSSTNTMIHSSPVCARKKKFSFTKYLHLSQIRACSHMVKQVLQLKYAVLEFRDLAIYLCTSLGY
jgi:hypothetical protein